MNMIIHNTVELGEGVIRETPLTHLSPEGERSMKVVSSCRSKVEWPA